MNDSRVLLLLTFSMLLVSSGCAEILPGSEQKRIVEEGTALEYESGKHSFSFLFFNGTEDTIYLNSTPLLTPSYSIETRKIYREDWSAADGEEVAIFLSGLVNRMDISDYQDSKLQSVMEEGGEATIGVSEGSKVNLTRSESFRKDGFQAYNVTIEKGDEGRTLTVHARSPYILIDSYFSESGMSLVNVTRTESPEDYSTSNNYPQSTWVKPEHDTEIDLGPVYLNDSGSSDEMEIMVKNEGNIGFNTSEFSIYYELPGSQTMLEREKIDEDWKVERSNDCLKEDRFLAVGEYFVCSTGVRSPDYGQELEIKVEADSFEYEKSKTCEPKTSDSSTC